MQYGERSAEAVGRCLNARAALQSGVLTGLLTEHPRQLEHGWTQDVIETLLLARTSWRGHRALRGHPRVQADRGHAGQARQGLREQEQSGAEEMKIQENIYNSNLLNRCPTISEESSMRIRIVVY